MANYILFVGNTGHTHLLHRCWPHSIHHIMRPSRLARFCASLAVTTPRTTRTMCAVSIIFMILYRTSVLITPLRAWRNGGITGLFTSSITTPGIGRWCSIGTSICRIRTGVAWVTPCAYLIWSCRGGALRASDTPAIEWRRIAVGDRLTIADIGLAGMGRVRVEEARLVCPVLASLLFFRVFSCWQKRKDIKSMLLAILLLFFTSMQWVQIIFLLLFTHAGDGSIQYKL